MLIPNHQRKAVIVPRLTRRGVDSDHTSVNALLVFVPPGVIQDRALGQGCQCFVEGLSKLNAEGQAALQRCCRHDLIHHIALACIDHLQTKAGVITVVVNPADASIAVAIGDRAGVALGVWLAVESQHLRLRHPQVQAADFQLQQGPLPLRIVDIDHRWVGVKGTQVNGLHDMLAVIVLIPIADRKFQAAGFTGFHVCQHDRYASGLGPAYRVGVIPPDGRLVDHRVISESGLCLVEGLTDLNTAGHPRLQVHGAGNIVYHKAVSRIHKANFQVLFLSEVIIPDVPLRAVGLHFVGNPLGFWLAVKGIDLLLGLTQI